MERRYFNRHSINRRSSYKLLLHIPSGGTTRNILRWSSSGTAVWDDFVTYGPASSGFPASPTEGDIHLMYGEGDVYRPDDYSIGVEVPIGYTSDSIVYRKIISSTFVTSKPSSGYNTVNIPHGIVYDRIISVNAMAGKPGGYLYCINNYSGTGQLGTWFKTIDATNVSFYNNITWNDPVLITLVYTRKK